MSEFVITLNDEKHSVIIDDGEIVIDGKRIDGFERTKINGYLNLLRFKNLTLEIPTIIKDRNNFTLLINGLKYDVTVRTKLEEVAREVMKNRGGGNEDREIKAPMPGLILALKKNVGDSVKKGDALFVLEAMKMENEIRATKEGVVKDVLVSEGSTVEKNQVVIIVE